MKTLFFIGFMGVGKTSVSAALGRMLKLPVIEMDQQIARNEGMTIPEIFAQKGEGHFRQCETALLEGLAAESTCLVSCGGGVAMRQENVAAMRRCGTVVLLTARPEVILDRVKDSDERPLLQGKKNVADIAALMAGAGEMMRTCAAGDMERNPAWRYAGARYELYRMGRKIEILAAYEPSFRFMAEWWKQLYGESEGKENKGLFPASVEFTADLHSMGQYIQQGERHLFESVVRFGPSAQQQEVPFDEGNGDGLNFLAGKSMDFIARQAMDGTLLAHVEGGVPNIIVETGSKDAHTLGELIYFFEYACGLSGYLLDVNPFDQPGVEAYKKNMFALLGKPGYEELRQTLLKKLKR